MFISVSVTFPLVRCLFCKHPKSNFFYVCNTNKCNVRIYIYIYKLQSFCLMPTCFGHPCLPSSGHTLQYQEYNLKHTCSWLHQNSGVVRYREIVSLLIQDRMDTIGLKSRCQDDDVHRIAVSHFVLMFMTYLTWNTLHRLSSCSR